MLIARLAGTDTVDLTVVVRDAKRQPYDLSSATNVTLTLTPLSGGAPTVLTGARLSGLVVEDDPEEIVSTAPPWNALGRGGRVAFSLPASPPLAVGDYAGVITITLPAGTQQVYDRVRLRVRPSP